MAGVPAAWVTADEAYGQDYKFRSWLEQRRIGYVVAVARSQTVPGSTGTSRADFLAAARARAGVETPQLRRRAPKAPGSSTGPSPPCRATQDTTPPGWSRWLLVRRALARNAKGELELAYYLCCRSCGHHR